VVAHADWSVAPGKRWAAVASRGVRGGYRLEASRPVADPGAFLAELRARAGPEGCAFLGVDFPIGLPAVYAAQAGIGDFLAVLPELGRGPWRDFFRVAERPEEVSLARPFYPARPGRKGAVSRRQLLDGLGLDDPSQLLRACDRATAGRPAAAALFWTLGAQQVGKAAIAGWCDLLIPALDTGHDLKIWPFDGPLESLFAPGRIVVAETYPAEVYRHLGLGFRRGGKRRQAGRAGNGATLIEAARRLAVTLDGPLRQAIEDGFGPTSGGEDPFDATVGLFGVLNVISGHRPPGPPDDPVVRKVEGWILGQAG
jgi:hypothetical protein